MPKSKFIDEIRGLLHFPNGIFIIFADLAKFIDLSQREREALIWHLENKWLSYFILSWAEPHFKDKDKDELAAKMILRYACIADDFENHFLDSEAIVKSFKAANGSSDFVGDNESYVDFLRKTRGDFDRYRQREDGFYDEFRRIASHNIFKSGSEYIHAMKNRMRYFN